MSKANPSAATPQISHSFAVSGCRAGVPVVAVLMSVAESIAKARRDAPRRGSRELRPLYALWASSAILRATFPGVGMEEPLRLLLAEDSPDDAALLEATLRAGGLTPDVH